MLKKLVILAIFALGPASGQESVVCSNDSGGQKCQMPPLLEATGPGYGYMGRESWSLKADQQGDFVISSQGTDPFGINLFIESRDVVSVSFDLASPDGSALDAADAFVVAEKIGLVEAILDGADGAIRPSASKICAEKMLAGELGPDAQNYMLLSGKNACDEEAVSYIRDGHPERGDEVFSCPDGFSQQASPEVTAEMIEPKRRCVARVKQSRCLRKTVNIQCTLDFGLNGQEICCDNHDGRGVPPGFECRADRDGNKCGKTYDANGDFIYKTGYIMDKSYEVSEADFMGAYAGDTANFCLSKVAGTGSTDMACPFDGNQDGLCDAFALEDAGYPKGQKIFIPMPELDLSNYTGEMDGDLPVDFTFFIGESFGIEDNEPVIDNETVYVSSYEHLFSQGLQEHVHPQMGPGWILIRERGSAFKVKVRGYDQMGVQSNSELVYQIPATQKTTEAELVLAGTKASLYERSDGSFFQAIDPDPTFCVTEGFCPVENLISVEEKTPPVAELENLVPKPFYWNIGETSGHAAMFSVLVIKSCQDPADEVQQCEAACSSDQACVDSCQELANSCDNIKTSHALKYERQKAGVDSCLKGDGSGAGIEGETYANLSHDPTNYAPECSRNKAPEGFINAFCPGDSEFRDEFQCSYYASMHCSEGDSACVSSAQAEAQAAVFNSSMAYCNEAVNNPYADPGKCSFAGGSPYSQLSEYAESSMDGCPAESVWNFSNTPRLEYGGCVDTY